MFFLAGMCFASWASRIPNSSLKLGLHEGQTGKLLLAIPVGSLLALPLAGWLVHRWGSRTVVLLAAMLYSVFLPLLGLASSFWTLAPALISPISFTGFLLGPPLIGLMAQLFSLRISFAIIAVVGLAIGVMSAGIASKRRVSIA